MVYVWRGNPQTAQTMKKLSPWFTYGGGGDSAPLSDSQVKPLENEGNHTGRRLATVLCWPLVESLATWCGVGGLILRKPYFPKTAGTAAQP